MIRYKYAALRPPGPIIHVRARNPLTGAEADRELALIDSAADRTLLPGRLANFLTLEPVGAFEIAGMDAKPRMYPTYDVEVFVPGRPAGFLVEAVAAENEPRIYLGRDVLNHLHILLDGPGLAVEFE